MTGDLSIRSFTVESKQADFLREAEHARLVAIAVATTRRPSRGRSLRRGIAGLVGAAFLPLGLAAGAAAHDGSDTAAAGNGGTALAGAGGGLILVGDITSGENAGGAIGVGDVSDGAVAIDGGSVGTDTGIRIDVAGGIGIAGAAGGDANVAVALD